MNPETMNLKHATKTAKVIELVCSSNESFEDAVTNGLTQAAKTIHNITGAEVKNFNVKCDNGKITEYRADVRVAFGIDD